MEVIHFTKLKHRRVKTLERGGLYYICSDYVGTKLGYGGAHCEFVITLSHVSVAPQKTSFINEHGELEETQHMLNDFEKIYIQPIPINPTVTVEPRWAYCGTMGILRNDDPNNYVLSHRDLSRDSIFVDTTKIPSKRRSLWKS